MINKSLIEMCVLFKLENLIKRVTKVFSRNSVWAL